jgi:hypothetical protein
MSRALCGSVVLKLYPDFLMYYLVVYIVCVVAVAAHHFPALASTLHRRLHLLGEDEQEHKS